jgi:hypothetical protein
MANRYLKSRLYTFETDLVKIVGTMTVGATGAVGTVKGMGIASVTRTGVGAYTVTLQDSYHMVWGHHIAFGGGTASGIGGVELVDTQANIKTNIRTNKQIKIQCYSATTTAADPANGTTMFFSFLVRNSNIGPQDY